MLSLEASFAEEEEAMRVREEAVPLNKTKGFAFPPQEEEKNRDLEEPSFGGDGR